MRPSRWQRQRGGVRLSLLFALALLLGACAGPSAPGSPSPTPTALTTLPTPTALRTAATTAISAATALPTATTITIPTVTAAPTVAPTPSPTAQPTPTPAATSIVPTAQQPPLGTRQVPIDATARPTGAAAAGISEGVSVIGAPPWHAAGITGKGVTVALLDESFGSYRKFLGDAKVTTKSFRPDGLIEIPNESIPLHGTACAEIVHEVAPDAALLLVTINSATTFVEAVQWLISTGQVGVISTSYGWFGGYSVNGASAQDQVVNRAKAAGIVFVSLAGNGGAGSFGSGSTEGHYAATFTDRDHDGFHDFTETPDQTPANGIKIRLTTDEMEVSLTWDGGDLTAAPYTFSLIPTQGDEIRASARVTSVNRHFYSALSGAYPAGTYLLKVRKVLSDSPDLPLRIYFTGAQLEHVTAAGSLWVPGDAEGAITVGALDWHTDTVRASSSHGPTADGRTKPDLVAPTCVTSAAYISVGSRIFCGTSAATPHVAGAVALYRQAYPSATPDEISAYFRGHAKRLTGPDGAPNTSGAGLIDLGSPPTRRS
jgi:subtilisin family serine protease